MTRKFDFGKQLTFSQGDAPGTYPAIIRGLLPGCVDVSKAPLDLDKRGADYVATFRHGATVFVDVKRREKGCSLHWSEKANGAGREPEVALEIYSVCPAPDRDGVDGWTLDASKMTDYTLHVFDPTDTMEAFLFPFQLLRAAFVRNKVIWLKRFKRKVQDSGDWKSECVFVPALVVLDAIQSEMSRRDFSVSDQPVFAPSIERGLIDAVHRQQLLDLHCVEPGTEEPIDPD